MKKILRKQSFYNTFLNAYNAFLNAFNRYHQNIGICEVLMQLFLCF